MKFYLGTHKLNWLWREPFRGIPLFVSHRQLRTRRTPFPEAITNWALDSGGFTELKDYGRWTITPGEYVTAVRRYQRELGHLDWASPQDWMCEPAVIEGGTWNGNTFVGTGLSVAEHQALTVANFLELCELAPDVPWVPVIQGWELADYEACRRLYDEAGVDLAAYPLVGVGSVCRRQDTDDIGRVMGALTDKGLNVHGFGVKGAGLAKYGDLMTSADSLAWSYGGRRLKSKPANCPSKGQSCSNCPHYALEWRQRVLDRMATSPSGV